MFDYEIVAANSLKLCRIDYGALYIHNDYAPAFEIKLYDADSNIIDNSEYLCVVKNARDIDVNINDITQEDFYNIVITPVNDHYVDSLIKLSFFGPIDALNLSSATVNMDRSFDYEDGLLLGVDIGKPTVFAAGTPDNGVALDESCYTLTYYKWDTQELEWVEVDSSDTTYGDYKVVIAGESPYYGTYTIWFSIGKSYDPGMESPDTSSPEPASGDKSGKEVETQSLAFASAALAA